MQTRLIEAIANGIFRDVKQAGSVWRSGSIESHNPQVQDRVSYLKFRVS